MQMNLLQAAVSAGGKQPNVWAWQSSKGVKSKISLTQVKFCGGQGFSNGKKHDNLYKKNMALYGIERQSKLVQRIPTSCEKIL